MRIWIVSFWAWEVCLIIVSMFLRIGTASSINQSIDWIGECNFVTAENDFEFRIAHQYYLWLIFCRNLTSSSNLLAETGMFRESGSSGHHNHLLPRNHGQETCFSSDGSPLSSPRPMYESRASRMSVPTGSADGMRPAECSVSQTSPDSPLSVPEKSTPVPIAGSVPLSVFIGDGDVPYKGKHGPKIGRIQGLCVWLIWQ